MTERRVFLGSILALATPPSFVRAGVLMPIKTPLNILWADGVRCDAEALEAWSHGGRVLFSDGSPAEQLVGRTFSCGRLAVLRSYRGSSLRRANGCTFQWLPGVAP